MSLIHNERTKLTATLMNNVAAAMFITGGIGPIVALSYGLPGPSGGWSALGITFIWILCGSAIHYMARLLLRGLKP